MSAGTPTGRSLMNGRSRRSRPGPDSTDRRATPSPPTLVPSGDPANLDRVEIDVAHGHRDTRRSPGERGGEIGEHGPWDQHVPRDVTGGDRSTDCRGIVPSWTYST